MDRFYVILMQLYISIRILFHYIFFLTHPLCQLFAYVSVSVRELGMVPYIKLFLDEAQYRGATLCILEHLAELNPDEFMSTAIGALCSSTQHELALKRDLLQVLASSIHPNTVPETPVFAMISVFILHQIITNCNALQI